MKLNHAIVRWKNELLLGITCNEKRYILHLNDGKIARLHGGGAVHVL